MNNIEQIGQSPVLYPSVLIKTEAETNAMINEKLSQARVV